MKRDQIKPEKKIQHILLSFFISENKKRKALRKIYYLQSNKIQASHRLPQCQISEQTMTIPVLRIIQCNSRYLDLPMGFLVAQW